MGARISFTSFALTLVFLVSTSSAELVVNEIANGNGGPANNFDQDEAFEILLTTDYTAAQLNGLAFGDSTGSTADKFSQFEIGDLSSISNTFSAGTLLVIAGNNFSQNLTYNPTLGGSDDDWSIILTANGGFFSPSATSDGDFAIGGTGDIIWVDFNNTGDADFAVDHAVGWDTGADGAFLTSGGNVVNAGFTTGLGTGDFVAFTGGGADTLTPSFFIDNGTTGSLGSANGGANTTYINSLRAIPEPGSLAMFGIAALIGLRPRRRQ